MIIDKNEWLIRNVLKSKLHTCVASEYGVAEFLSTSNDPNIGIPELEGLSCCCGTILRAENYNKFLLITSLLICDRDDTHCTRKKIRSVEGRRNDSMLRISFFSHTTIRPYILFDISLEQSFFFFFSSFFSRLLLFPFYDGIRIVLVIIIAYFDCQCIIITITITTIIALRHVYLDEQNKDNFSRMAVTINDETCDKITMRGDYTVKMYRRSQDRRQYATSLLLSRNTICQSCKRVIIFRHSHARQWYAVRCDTRTMWTQRVEEKQKNDCFSTYTHFTQSTTKISKRTNILKKNCPHTSSIARLCV